MTEAIILPGQGAQFAGMGRDWAEAEPRAKRIFERADEVLGFALSDAIWADGAGVNRTDVAQPGILTTSVAVLSCLEERGLDLAAAPVTAGLSLGEYTALWCAGSLDFEDAVQLVRLRGEAMQDASDRIKSSMTSLMGADRETAEKLAEQGREHGICAVANLNAPGQVVLSGELAALDAVEAAAREHGVKRAIRLTVAGGFHSECMRPAADRLRERLAEVTVRTPRIPFVSNVTGGPLTDPEEIKTALAQQLCSPVLWEASMRWCLEQGIHAFLEPGPGNVLAGLMRRIAKEVGVEASVRGVEHPEDLAG
jgi:[acyl-carrier-protein] S-malonyltransferase